MRPLFVACFILGSIMLSSCNRTPPPTAPGSQPPKPQSHLVLSFAGYGAALDSTYYKVWSDSSWEEYAGDTTISGTKYSVLLSSTGYEYFYGPEGYAGFWPYGGSLIMFDSTLASLPDTLIEGKTYTLETTFTTGGVSYTLSDMEVLEDSGSVTVPFGTFFDCLHLQSTSAISGTGQSQSQTIQYWYAKGPSDIERQFSGQTILMAYGVVNGKGWGVNIAGQHRRRSAGPTASESERAGVAGPQRANRIDLRIALPMILRGVIR